MKQNFKQSIIGFMCIFGACVVWGILPINIKYLNNGITAFNLLWLQCIFSLVLLVIYYIITKKQIPLFKKKLTRKEWLFSSMMVLSSISSLIFFFLGAKHLSAEGTLVIYQFAPLFFLLGCVIFYKERMSKIQLFGFFFMIVGSLFFFYVGVTDLYIHFSKYLKGIIFIFLATISWSSYALAQKPLLETKKYTSIDLYFILALGGAILLLPLARPLQLQVIDSNFQVFCFTGVLVSKILTCVLFTESLQRWSASKTSAVMTSNPLIAYFCVVFFAWLLPSYIPPTTTNILGFISMIVLAAGAFFVTTKKSNHERKEMIKTNYNNNAEKYGDFINNHRQSEQKLHSKVIIDTLPKKSKMLEIGCGNGPEKTTKNFIKHFDYTGIDFSHSQINLAKQKYPKSDFICSDMIKLEYPKNIFDVITGIYCLFLLPFKEQEQMIGKMYKWLKPNGYMYIAVWNKPHNESKEVPLFDGDHNYNFSANNYKKIIKKYGFKILSISKEYKEEVEISQPALWILAQK
jgi:drug/metabolite transporter (DMT)-like permease/ubiquinone/menaquinone biosynthesis C-methylase UbiE